jgi:hypothetical protein
MRFFFEAVESNESFERFSNALQARRLRSSRKELKRSGNTLKPSGKPF